MIITNYSKFISPAWNSEASCQQKLEILCNQVAKKIQRIVHFVLILVLEKRTEWINNQFILNKIEKEVSALHSLKEKNPQKIEESSALLRSVCTVLNKSISDSKELQRFHIISKKIELLDISSEASAKSVDLAPAPMGSITIALGEAPKSPKNIDLSLPPLETPDHHSTDAPTIQEIPLASREIIVLPPLLEAPAISTTDSSAEVASEKRENETSMISGSLNSEDAAVPVPEKPSDLNSKADDLKPIAGTVCESSPKPVFKEQDKVHLIQGDHTKKQKRRALFSLAKRVGAVALVGGVIALGKYLLNSSLASKEVCLVESPYGETTTSLLHPKSELNRYLLENSPKDFQNPKICLFTSFTVDNPQRLQLSEKVAKNQQLYAKSKGYQYAVYKENLAAPLEPYWSKIAAILKILRGEDSSITKPEWIVWLDDDAIISNQNVRFEEIILANLRTKKPGELNLIVTEDSESFMRPDVPLNSAVLIVKNDEKSLELFEKVWEMRDQKVHSRSYTYGNCKNQECLHEQQALTDLLRSDPNWNRHVMIIPQRDERTGYAMNTFHRWPHYDINRDVYLDYNDGRRTQWGEQDFIGQCTGLATNGAAHKYSRAYNVREACVDQLVNAPLAPKEEIKVVLEEEIKVAPEEEIKVVLEEEIKESPMQGTTNRVYDFIASWFS